MAKHTYTELEPAAIDLRSLGYSVEGISLGLSSLYPDNSREPHDYADIIGDAKAVIDAANRLIDAIRQLEA